MLCLPGEDFNEVALVKAIYLLLCRVFTGETGTDSTEELLEQDE